MGEVRAGPGVVGVVGRWVGGSVGEGCRRGEGGNRGHARRRNRGPAARHVLRIWAAGLPCQPERGAAGVPRWRAGPEGNTGRPGRAPVPAEGRPVCRVTRPLSASPLPLPLCRCTLRPSVPACACTVAVVPSLECRRPSPVLGPQPHRLLICVVWVCECEGTSVQRCAVRLAPSIESSTCARAPHSPDGDGVVRGPVAATGPPHAPLAARWRLGPEPSAGTSLAPLFRRHTPRAQPWRSGALSFCPRAATTARCTQTPGLSLPPWTARGGARPLLVPQG